MVGKNMMPAYNELVNTPLFIWDPRTKRKGETRHSLSSTYRYGTNNS